MAYLILKSLQFKKVFWDTKPSTSTRNGGQNTHCLILIVSFFFFVIDISFFLSVKISPVQLYAAIKNGKKRHKEWQIHFL